jgi:hypothetical protein
VEPVYVDGSLTDEVLAEKVAATGLVSTPYLVTTRLDNDDALAIDHLAMSKAHFSDRNGSFSSSPSDSSHFEISSIASSGHPTHSCR